MPKRRDDCDYSDYDIAMSEYCTDCGEECTSSEESFDYGGTHCTHGVGGTHNTGVYSSNCCNAEVTNEKPCKSTGE